MHEDKEKKENVTDKGVDKMATLAYPCKAPMIIKEGRYEHFLEKCKRSAISSERKEQYLEYAKKMHKDDDKQTR